MGRRTCFQRARSPPEMSVRLRILAICVAIEWLLPRRQNRTAWTGGPVLNHWGGRARRSGRLRWASGAGWRRFESCRGRRFRGSGKVRDLLNSGTAEGAEGAEGLTTNVLEVVPQRSREEGNGATTRLILAQKRQFEDRSM